MSVIKTRYGIMPNGDEVYEYFIEGNNGTGAGIITLGATLDKLLYKNKDGELLDLLLGFDDLRGHLERSDYQGVVVGRYANRIGGGKFTLDGTEYHVTKNEKDITCLHGGGEFSSAVWNAEILDDKSVAFTYRSHDMNEGFPGNMDVKVIYTLSENDELRLDYYACSDKTTVVNLTNHAYFNLNGYNGGSIADHILTVNADRYTPIDKNSIPFGELEAVKDTPFDFTEPKKIGKDIDYPCEQLINGKGYDHNFCLNAADGTLRTAAIAKSEKSGITLTVKTTLPGVQLYTGNFLVGVLGKGGLPMNYRTGFCLETQYFPNTPNNPSYPSCVLHIGEEYRSSTVFALSRE